MKKIISILTFIACLGAGCSNALQQPTQAPFRLPTTEKATSTTKTEIKASPTTSTSALLKPLPSIASSTQIDDKDWINKSTPYPAVTLTFPVKGPYAIVWKHRILSAKDSHLRGDCYVTNETIYQKTNFEGFAVGTCQTTTDYSADHGIRTDYFVLRGEDGIHLFTFTKSYRQNFDMNTYAATLDHVLNIID